ncbi:MAG: T9SS type A sorting domain-containing protein [Bacteroidia bacterium]|nr:T9SS type A sorting domain-containing protein [Bacteroidia bacterium]
MKFFQAGFLFIVFSIIACGVQAQKRGAVWCFGDSALVDFSDTSNILTGTSAVKSRGSCTSISDSSGALLFYVAYDPTVTIGGTDPVKVYGQNNLVIDNGDSIKGGGWYHELISLPFPGSDNLFYVFNIGVTLDFGLYYAIVDMSLNGGLGAVIQKNVQLENFKTVDCLNAIKHGNGRDWWVIIRRFDAVSNPNNDYYIYLVSPSGISSQPIQSVGTQNPTNSGRISFNSQGTKMAFINYVGLIELYDFDRCNGLISNPVTIQPESAQAPWPGLWSAEYSPSGNILYVTRIPAVITDSSRLFQYDLLAPNISASKLTLWSAPWTTTIDQLKMAPDNKMYLTTNFGQVYPYTDSMYNSINMNLSVINSPDSLGTACDLQPFSFYLGGKRSYAGLPNNPDYDLPALVGSPCDTLVSQNELAGAAAVGNLHVYYHSDWDKAFINASNLKGKTGKLLLYDMQGKVVHSEPLRIQNGYYNRDLSMMGMADGVYLVVVETELERLVKKVLID